MMYDQGDSIQMAGIVFKTSNTGLTHNERFLVLKEGFLYYYSQVPKNYNQGTTDIRSSFIQSMPKHSVSVAHINMIRGDAKTPSQFTVEFEHKHLMGEKDIRESINNSNFSFQPKNINDKEIVSWKFKVGNKDTRQKWIGLIKTAREKEIKEKVMIETLFNSYGQGGRQSVGQGGGEDFRKSFIPWGENYEDQKKKAMDFRKKDKEEEKKREEERRREEEVERQREKEEKRVREEREREEREKREMMARLKEEARVSLQRQMREEEEERVRKQEAEAKERQEREREDAEREREREENQKEIETRELIPSEQQPQQRQKILDEEQQDDQLQRQQEQTISEQEKEKLIEYFQQSPSLSKPGTASYAEEESKLVLNPHQAEESIVTEFNINDMRSFHRDDSRVEEVGNTRLTKIKTSPNQISRLVRESSAKPNTAQKHYQSIISVKQSRAFLESNNDFAEQYYSLLTEIHSGSFQDRLEIQARLYSCVSRFRDVATDTFKEMIDQEKIDLSKSTTYQQEGIVFTIGVCKLEQAPKKKGNLEYSYDESKIKEIQKIFKGYQEMVGKLVKYSRQNSIGLVIPLVSLMEYKGIVGLAVHNNSENETMISRIELENLSEAMKSIGINQSKLLIREHKHKKCYVIYVKQPIVSAHPKSQTLSFDFPLDSQFLHKAILHNCSLSLAHLQKYRQLLLTTRLSPQTKDVIEALSYCIFLKYIRKIYRSSQGELNQTGFWNLLLKKDKQLMKLITNMGCQYIPQYKGVMMSYIRYYFGIEIEFEGSKMFEGEFPVKNVGVHPKTKVIKFEGTELQETLALFDTYVGKNKFQLAREVVGLGERIYESVFDKEELHRVLYNKALVLNLQCSYLPSASILQSIIPHLSPHSTFKLKLYFLLIKNYSQLQNDKIFILFKNTIDLISINYGQNHYQLITLNCIMAHYCAYKKKDLQNARKFYQLALMLAQNYYDGGSVEIIEVLVDIGRMYGNAGNYEEAGKYLETVSKMMREVSIGNVDEAKKVKLGISVATILMELGKVGEAMGKLREVEGICTDDLQLYQLSTLQYHLLLRSTNPSPSSISSLLHKLFLLSSNLKTLKSTISLTLSSITSSLTRSQQQRLIVITDKMFVDGDCNHIELIKEKMGSNSFGDYVMRVIKGLCSVDLESEGYEELLNRYQNVVGVMGKQWIVALIEGKMVETGSTHSSRIS